MKTDSEIAFSAPVRPVSEIGTEAGVPPEYLIPFGRYAAKIDSRLLEAYSQRPDGKLILVTAMSPTPTGEGKTTLTIGLSQSLKLLGKKVMACLRQPSIGPLFGAKGGATGAGYSQVIPPADISLQFTGDDYAIVTAHNLISSVIDNHIYHGNKLGIDKDRILWNRVSTVNDRALRKIKIGLGKAEGERVEEFHISAASEIMSILCLSKDLSDLKERVKRLLLAFDREGRPVTAGDLKIDGAASALLRNAIHPNLVQSVEGVPVLVHGGPFGNISIGTNSLMATRLALKLGDYVLTEAGFATELGAEKFFDIKCRAGNLKPSLAVIVVTLKALKFHGGSKDCLSNDREAIVKGLSNLKKHLENIGKFKLPSLVVINRFNGDSPEELEFAAEKIRELGTEVYVTDVRDNGGRGGVEAAKTILRLTEEDNGFNQLYALEKSVKEKIATIAREMYGAEGVIYAEEAERDIDEIERLGWGKLPVCVAKTPKSLSDDPALTGRPEGFKVTVRRVKPALGAGFLVAVAGSVLLMPGLPEHPLAEGIGVDGNGKVTGL